MQWLNSRSCCNSRIISSISQPTTGLDSNLGKTKMKRERAWGGAQFSDVWTCKGCDIENGSVLWNMNSYHHELPKDLIAAEAIAQAICQRSQSSRSCLTQTAGGDVAPVLPCTLQRKYTQNHRATCPVALQSLNLFWRWRAKGSSFKSSGGKPQASTRHLWCNTLDTTTQHWIKHTVEIADDKIWGQRTWYPILVKAGRQHSLEISCLFLPNLYCVTGLENNT